MRSLLQTKSMTPLTATGQTRNPLMHTFSTSQWQRRILRPGFLSYSATRTYLQSSHQPAGYLREVRGKTRLMWTCIGINICVWTAWYSTSLDSTNLSRAQNHLKQRVHLGLYRNFMLSIDSIKEKRLYTAITSGFSHQAFWHLTFNMLAFHAFSSVLIYTPGILAVKHFSPLILGSIVSGSLAFLTHDMQRSDRSRRHRLGLGFSGAVSGLATATACLAPHTKMAVFGLPMPLWILGVGYIAYDAYSMQGPSNIGHDAHLGGAFFGGLWYLLVLRRFGGILGPRRSMK